MQRIGDVMRKIPVRPPDSNAPSGVKISRPETAKCPICQDAGYLRADVPVGHPSFGRLFQCECRRKELNAQRAESLRQLSNVEVFTNQSFDDFDPEIPGLGEAYDAALEFAQVPGHRWLVLTGPCGTGKTHLAVSIANYAMEYHNMSVYFAVVPDLLDHLRATFDPSSGTAYDERFATIRSADLLVLDDLGTENTTPWAREKLYQIINHRYMEQLPTVITSNVDLEKIDERVASRILDHRLSQHIEVDAEDYRRPGAPRKMKPSRRDLPRKR